MLPGRGYSIIYRAITGNCTLQQFVDSHCTVLNLENMNCANQDTLEKSKKNTLQTQKYFSLCFSPRLLKSLCHCYPCHTVSRTCSIWKQDIAGIPSDLRIWRLPCFTLKAHFQGLRLSLFPLFKLLSTFSVLSVKKNWNMNSKKLKSLPGQKFKSLKEFGSNVTLNRLLATWTNLLGCSCCLKLPSSLVENKPQLFPCVFHTLPHLLCSRQVFTIGRHSGTLFAREISSQAVL